MAQGDTKVIEITQQVLGIRSFLLFNIIRPWTFLLLVIFRLVLIFGSCLFSFDFEWMIILFHVLEIYE